MPITKYQRIVMSREHRAYSDIPHMNDKVRRYIRAGIKEQTKREMKSYIQTEMAHGKNITMKTNRKMRTITINGRRFFIV